MIEYTHGHNQGQSFPQSQTQLMVKCGTGLAPKLREGTSLFSGAAQTHSLNEGISIPGKRGDHLANHCFIPLEASFMPGEAASSALHPHQPCLSQMSFLSSVVAGAGSLGT